MVIAALGGCTETRADLVLCVHTSHRWAWIIPEERKAIPQMQGWIFLRPLLHTEGMQAFAEQVSEYTASNFNIDLPTDSVDLTYSAALYNAIMLYAHAATKVLSEDGDHHDGKAVTAAIRSTSFKGAGGTLVRLDSNGDRVESYEVMNYVVEGDMTWSVAVGMYNCTLQQYRAHERAIVWPGKTMAVPVDYFLGELQRIMIDKMCCRL